MLLRHIRWTECSGKACTANMPNNCSHDNMRQHRGLCLSRRLRYSIWETEETEIPLWWHYWHSCQSRMNVLITVWAIVLLQLMLCSYMHVWVRSLVKVKSCLLLLFSAWICRTLSFITFARACLSEVCYAVWSLRLTTENSIRWKNLQWADVFPLSGTFSFCTGTMEPLHDTTAVQNMLDTITDALIHHISQSGCSVQQQSRRQAQLLLLLSHIRHMRWNWKKVSYF